MKSSKASKAVQICIAIVGFTALASLYYSGSKRSQSYKSQIYSYGSSKSISNQPNSFSQDYPNGNREALNFSNGKKESWQNSSGNLGNDVLYYIMVDRFHDGDPSNNRPKVNPSYPPRPVEEKVEQSLSDNSYDGNHRLFGLFFGGDLKGVEKKLAYLKSLGVTKIVLSPIQDGPAGYVYSSSANTYLDNNDRSVDKTNRSRLTTNYHGYWLRDWFRMDPHYRSYNSSPDSFKDLRSLLNSAQAKGIGVLLDLTVHQASMHYLSKEELPGLNTKDFQNIFASNSEIRRKGIRLASWKNKKDSKQSIWYDPACQMDYQRPNSNMLDTCVLAPGLPTLNHANSAVEDYLLDAAEFWMKVNPGGAQIKGYRIDAAKNLSYSFLKKLVTRVRQVNPSSIIFAENFGFGSQSIQTANLIKNSGNISVIDFDFTDSARYYFSDDRSWFGHRSNLENASTGSVVGWRPFEFLPTLLTNPSRILEPIFPKNLPAAKSWVTYIHEHDLPGLRTFRPGMNDAQYAAMIAFLFAGRGVPMITWGGEIGLSVPPLPRNHGLNGMGGDPFDRPMMVFPGQTGYNNRLAFVTQSMAYLRIKYPVLRYGDTFFLRDKVNPFPGQTIIMLRKPGQEMKRMRDAESTSRYNLGSEKLASILYAYAPRGGKFRLNLGQGASKSIICDYTNPRCNALVKSNDFTLELKPNTFRVMIIRPNA